MDVNEAGPSNVSRGLAEEVPNASILLRLEAMEAFKSTVLDEMASMRSVMENELASMRSMMEKTLAAIKGKSRMGKGKESADAPNAECHPTEIGPVEIMQAVDERIPASAENEDVGPAVAEIVREIGNEKEVRVF